MPKFIYSILAVLLMLSCSKKTNKTYPENIKNTIITSIEIPSEVKQNEVIHAKINFMLFNPCWSFYNVEKCWNKDTLFLKVNIQKNTEEMCMEMIVNSTQEYEFKIKEKGHYQIKYTNDKREEIILPLLVK